jgi:hypothetical protein
MVERQLAPNDSSMSTSLVLAKDSGRKSKTPERAARRALVPDWLDIAKFVRDGMTRACDSRHYSSL